MDFPDADFLVSPYLCDIHVYMCHVLTAEGIIMIKALSYSGRSSAQNTEGRQIKT